VVERCPREAEQHWPGRIFENLELDYEEAMQAYVAATRDRTKHAWNKEQARTGWDAERLAWRREEEALKTERHQIRERRKQEDAAWNKLRQQVRTQRQAYGQLPKIERQKQPQFAAVLEQQWQLAWAQRRTSIQKRQLEDADWRVKRQQIRERANAKPTAQAWFALLAVTDNCTRQCLGVPVFADGAKVKADTVTLALEAILPPELQYLISDQGSHFRTAAFAKLVARKGFIWVPVYRHRAQSNGIAERFIRTLKEWLADKAWHSSAELEALLAIFLAIYNDRPHQGLPIPGLSPNEFARRVWLM
jgi:transposase InsO family protein